MRDARQSKSRSADARRWVVLRRRIGSVVAGALMVVVAGAAGPAQARDAEGAERVPEFDFGACPARAELPADADPGTWRCEAMEATGHLKVGGVDEPIDRPIRITFAEGRVDGAFRQVFGDMTAEPIRVGGSPLTLTPQYGGYSDFESDDVRRGELDLTFAVGLRGVPGGGHACAVGSDRDAVHLVLQDTDPTRVISEEPLVVAFGAEDRRFAVPCTSGCGPLGRVLDHRLDLPSPVGDNRISLDAVVGIRPYE
ncbi:hypothetical protein DSC45_28865 [Streptomyces sp. YIM 130001]|uniref:hypothetical protein n=1 Tax=Streptomyces sp. YIM 130001 TaxID=2259644 RepID=UPI000EBFA24B|nr:hypothetical protein [Streptomyces sp. YIM 130001]RII11303.1 hypothetical protein DSC45_28865 [Streptomyces sp. YIM 130001]